MFALTVTASLAADHTLLEFRKISQIHLILRYETIQITTNENILNEIQILFDDLNNFNCTSSDCKNGKNIIASALSKKNSTLITLFEEREEKDKALKRRKREWDYFGKSLKWMGGVMDSDDRQVLNRKVNILYENQKTIYDQLESALSGLTSKPEALIAERGEFNEVERDLKHVHELIGLQTISERYEKISALIDGFWRTFFNKKIDGIFVTSEAIEKLRDLPNIACERIVDCIKNADADVQYENSRFIINLKIPITNADRHLNLYEITSIPSDVDNVILLLKFPQKYFAFDKNNKKIITLNENNFNLCKRSDDSSIMYCKAQDIIANVNNDECLEKAFFEKTVDSKLCFKKMELLQASGFGIIEISNGRYWLHTKNRKDMVINCNENDHQVKTFTESQTFRLDFGCHALFRNDGIDLTSYAFDESQKLKSINASISKADFVDIIESMSISKYLQNGFQINLQAYQPKGLEPIEVKYHQPATANELKTIRAQHNEALLIVVIIAVSLMFYLLLSRGKPYVKKFLLSQKQKEDIEESQEIEQNLNNNKL